MQNERPAPAFLYRRAGLANSEWCHRGQRLLLLLTPLMILIIHNKDLCRHFMTDLSQAINVI